MSNLLEIIKAEQVKMHEYENNLLQPQARKRREHKLFIMLENFSVNTNSVEFSHADDTTECTVDGVSIRIRGNGHYSDYGVLHEGAWKKFNGSLEGLVSALSEPPQLHKPAPAPRPDFFGMAASAAANFETTDDGDGRYYFGVAVVNALLAIAEAIAEK